MSRDVVAAIQLIREAMDQCFPRCQLGGQRGGTILSTSSMDHMPTATVTETLAPLFGGPTHGLNSSRVNRHDSLLGPLFGCQIGKHAGDQVG